MDYEGSLHLLRLRVLCPTDLRYAKPYLTTLRAGGLAEAAELELDLREGLPYIKECVLAALGGK